MYDIRIYVHGITCYVMLELLHIYNLWFSALKVGDFYGTGTVNLLDKVRAFPFGEKLSCRKPETRLIQQNFVTNVKFSFQNSFIVPLLVGVYTSRWLPQVQGDDDVDSSNFSLTWE